MCFELCILFVIMLKGVKKEKNGYYVNLVGNLKCYGIVETPLTRLNVFPILSVIVFFLRCLLHTAKQCFIASDARTICSCSNVKTASKNRKTQLPME